MSMPASLFHTAEMVRNLPDDGNRYETVHGELLVSPSPRLQHQAVLRELMLTPRELPQIPSDSGELLSFAGRYLVGAGHAGSA